MKEEKSAKLRHYISLLLEYPYAQSERAVMIRHNQSLACSLLAITDQDTQKDCVHFLCRDIRVSPRSVGVHHQHASTMETRVRLGIPAETIEARFFAWTGKVVREDGTRHIAVSESISGWSVAAKSLKVRCRCLRADVVFFGDGDKHFLGVAFNCRGIDNVRALGTVGDVEEDINSPDEPRDQDDDFYGEVEAVECGLAKIPLLRSWSAVRKSRFNERHVGRASSESRTEGQHDSSENDQQYFVPQSTLTELLDGAGHALDFDQRQLTRQGGNDHDRDWQEGYEDVESQAVELQRTINMVSPGAVSEEGIDDTADDQQKSDDDAHNQRWEEDGERLGPTKRSMLCADDALHEYKVGDEE